MIWFGILDLFMICDPRKLATSPNSTSSSSSSSWKRTSNRQMQFGVPIPVICDWLNQHWEGNLDEHAKPKSLIRLMSSGQKTKHSCASFAMRRVFKTADADDNNQTLSSSKARDQTGPTSSAAVANINEEERGENQILIQQAATIHLQGIPTPEIYESPKLTSVPLRKKDTGQIQLLDINFPPKIAKVTTLPCQPIKYPQLNSFEEKRPGMEQLPSKKVAREGQNSYREAEIASEGSDAQVASTGSINGAHSEVISSSSPSQVPEMYDNHGYRSEEETLYSAETAESRNYPSPPKEGKFHHQVGRSQSVEYRWGIPQKSSAARRAMLEKQRSLIHGKKVYSQGATSQRSNEYFSPTTVSSIMKKKNRSEQQLQQMNKPLPRAVSSSPRWMF